MKQVKQIDPGTVRYAGQSDTYYHYTARGTVDGLDGWRRIYGWRRILFGLPIGKITWEEFPAPEYAKRSEPVPANSEGRQA